MNCALCKHENTKLILTHNKREFYQCQQCDLIFVPKQFHITAEQEKARYDTHQNNPDNPGYREFLQKLTTPLLQYLKPGMQGLDFGSGPEPVLQALLMQAGFITDIYDPYYANQPQLLNQQYDFVTCTEVVEHFRDPFASWQMLTKLVKTNGYLAVMTQLHDTTTNFANWWYKNDPTHVAFYSQKTIQWLGHKFLFGVVIGINNVFLLKIF